MKGKKILIGITGSIAAYKIPELCRMLIKQGAEVKVMMTPSAKDFVSPLVLGTLTRNKVYVELFDEDTWSNHVMLGRWADLLVIAPASCNTISKMANGNCDNFLLATYLSATCPVAIAPAMDEDMWHHPSTKRNLSTLRNDGVTVFDSEHGELASGLVGMGRMLELQKLVDRIEALLQPHLPLAQSQILITAGPTNEYIDPVRFIGNASSGKMGIAIAEACAALGAKVHLVLGPTNLRPSHKNITTLPVRSADEMYKKCTSLFKKCNIAIMTAAVSDFTPKTVTKQKIKKGADQNLTVELVRTKDILKQLGTVKQKHQFLVGFALETDNELAYAQKKLKEKNADMIVLNSLKTQGAGFGVDTNQVSILLKNGTIIEGSLKSKAEVAQDIVAEIIKQSSKKK